MTLDFCRIIGNGFFGGATAVAPEPETQMSFGISSTSSIDPVFTALGLSNSDFTWTKPDGVSTFTGKAPAASNFNQVGVYKIACTNWNLVTNFVADNDHVNFINTDIATKLGLLNVQDNTLTALDVSKNTALLVLLCGFNYGISTINLTGLTVLNTISCEYNLLTTLDVSGQSSILYVTVSNNSELASITGLAGKPGLKEFIANECNLTSVNLSGCRGLWAVQIEDNRLTQSVVDSVLVACLDAANYNHHIFGVCYVDGGGSAPAGDDGIAAAASLVDDYAWDVLYN